MDRKFFVYTFGLLQLIGLAGLILYYLHFNRLAFITETALVMGQLGGFFLLLQEGKLIRSKPFLFSILIFTGITITGALLKIMHWPLNNFLLLTGLVGTIFTYTIHFIKKADKQRLDLLKYIWVLAAYISAILIIQHYPFREVLKDIPRLIFFLVYIDFAYTNYWWNQLGDKKSYH